MTHKNKYYPHNLIVPDSVYESYKQELKLSINDIQTKYKCSDIEAARHKIFYKEAVQNYEMLQSGREDPLTEYYEDPLESLFGNLACIDIPDSLSFHEEYELGDIARKTGYWDTNDDDMPF